MFSLFKNFFKRIFNKQFSLKNFADWLNYSLWNRAIFVYTSATLSILVRYCLYSFHHDSWVPNSVTVYSALFSYLVASAFLFVFGVLRTVTFSDYLRRFIDIDRIRENRARTEKFRSLVVETHNVQEVYKVYSYNSGLVFSISFMFLAMSSGKSSAATVCVLVLLFDFWWLFNVLYFARCMQITPVPDELKTIKPSWVRRWEAKRIQDEIHLMNGVGNSIAETTSASGLGRRLLNKASKATTRSVSYLTDVRNLPTIIKASVGVGTAIFGLDYTSAEANQRTSYLTRAIEDHTNGTYSPDPDTRSKAAALRRRNISLLDCCEPNSRCLSPELVENKYEMFRPYETQRYLSLEQEKLALEQEKLALEQEKLALEQENRKLLLKLEDPGLK